MSHSLHLSWLLLAPLLAGGCGGETSAASRAVPPLPKYVQSFDARVRDLLQQTHQELLADPQDPERWMKLGMVFEAHSEASQAEGCYLRALALRDDRPRWWYRLAMAREASNKIEGSLEALEHTILLSDEYGPAHCRRGSWMLEMGDTKEARKCFERALALDSSDPSALLGLIAVHLRLEENERAVAALEGSALLRGPNRAWAQRQLGTAYQRVGRTREASALLASTRSAKPRFKDPWKARINRFRRGMASINRQARSLIAAGSTQQAIRLLQEARAQEPGHVPILRTLGAAYAAAGAMQESFETLRSALQLDPNNVELRVDTTWAVAMGGDIPGALRRVDEILGNSPDSAKAHALRSQLLLDLARPEDALEAFREAMARGHRDPRMLVDIGKTLMQANELEEARVCFARAALQDPGSQSAWIGQAICAVDLGQLESAATALARAEELARAQPGSEQEVVAQIRSQLRALQAAAASK